MTWKQWATPRRAVAAMMVGIALALAGCGGGNTASSASGPTAPVKVGTATVKGKSEQVLTTKSGMTLYYHTTDTRTQSKCTTTCPSLWPPLLTSHKSLSDPSGLSKPFTVVHDKYGSQISYNGHLLYTYSGDTKSGQANGQGILGTWFVATPNLAAKTKSSGSNSNGGYGGYGG